MIKLKKEQVLFLHNLLIAETGGVAEVRDIGLLDSALESAYATFGGKDLYPTKEEKAAKIGYSLIANHAFADGNKRIGALVMLTFLEVNGIRTVCPNGSIADIAMRVARGEADNNDILAWINENKES